MSGGGLRGCWLRLVCYRIDNDSLNVVGETDWTQNKGFGPRSKSVGGSGGHVWCWKGDNGSWYPSLSDFTYLTSSNRYVNIGLDGRHFACPDAKPDDLLPMDEQRWESGVRLTPFPHLPLIVKFFLCHKG